ncbi:dTDP-4-dehydrorhamnose reductase [Mycolicibacterium confluentis]|uniref:dTDP-4-dehydrorhamnose reductase n=1 Tax=Mycolicibacterium confluentis TaxID=28047 RepID=UPI000A163E0C|nr:dTDP-4-dehydrorhamnose reductase [Mycolicibacterium confluentis]MCV7319826.1 dTDP-4-dehydrorhamnose reductase [Mycolicibacterium confluentis]ORV34406.1 NAD(P)-dependent oxidoreductase [Mycolicibacterium confluentis]
MSERIVITGAGGQVGRFLARRAEHLGRRVLALTSAQWDITDPSCAPALTSDDVVINCAAMTNVDAAEGDPDRAFAVNAAGAGHVAGACARVGARVVHISTDYVFSGDFGGAAPRPYEPDDAVSPLSVYGHSKLAGEHAVLEAVPTATVVRTSWVYTGADGPDFAAVMARRARAGEAAEVVDDQIGSPTYTGDLVTALLQIIDDRLDARVLHAANAGATSRYEQARAVYAAVGADPDLVRPVSTDRFPRPAARPAYSVLGSRLSTAAGLTALQPWPEAVAQALAEA